jgi:pimeloyl-ACP methyl ester carboxylesterase
MRLFLALLLASPVMAADLDALFEQADADHWSERWRAVQAMARVEGDGVPLLRAALLREERARVREAVAWACLLDPGLGNATLLGLALRKDPDAAVRRGAAHALVHFRDRRAVSALVEALVRERDRRTRLRIIETLRALTPAPHLLEPQEWRDWWKRNEHDPRFRPADQPPGTDTYEGVVLETRTVAAVPGKRQPKRPPPHLLVLPQFGWSNPIYGPYLLPLRRYADLTWVRLPTVQALTGQSGFGDSIPNYPVGRLVQALDRFRAAHRIERFVVVATGASGWIAMSYAHRFPKRCAGLVLIDTHLDKQAYADALRRGAARGNEVERWIAKTLLHENNVPLNEPTLHRLHRIGLQRGYRDRADLEMGWLFATAREPQGFATVPDLKWGRHTRLEMPSLFVFSPANAFSGHHDDQRIGRNFPNSMVAPVRECRGLPWVEHNERFCAIVERFLVRYDLIDDE